MARLTAPGPVVGMDINPEMIRAAEDAHPPSTVPNLVFYVGDIRASQWDGEFNVVNASRTLQWIPDAGLAMSRIARAVVSGGRVVVLDVDQALTEWLESPREWTCFHEAFLSWRTALGLDNSLGRHLTGLSDTAGLVEACVMPMTTTVRAGEPGFFRAAGFWRMMADSRGRQMVAAGHLTEAKRESAFHAFTEWMQRPDVAQTTHEVCLMARRP